MMAASLVCRCLAVSRSDRRNDPAAEALRQASGSLLLSPFVLAELDYLLCTRMGLHAELAVLDEVA